MRWYVRFVLNSKNDCMSYLRRFGMFVNPRKCKGSTQESCNTKTVELTHCSQLKWRFPDATCQTYRSIACGNDFLMKTSVTGNYRRQLRQTDIVQIVCLSCYSGMKISTAAAVEGVSRNTISKWYNACHDVCSTTESMLPEMTGTEAEPLQIDESYFAGRRK